MEQTQEVDRKDLKIQALLEKMGQQTASYENLDSDRRVEITVLSARVQELEAELAKIKGEEVNNDPADEAD